MKKGGDPVLSGYEKLHFIRGELKGQGGWVGPRDFALCGNSVRLAWALGTVSTKKTHSHKSPKKNLPDVERKDSQEKGGGG